MSYTLTPMDSPLSLQVAQQDSQKCLHFPLLSSRASLLTLIWATIISGVSFVTQDSKLKLRGTTPLSLSPGASAILKVTKKEPRKKRNP